MKFVGDAVQCKTKDGGHKHITKAARTIVGKEAAMGPLGSLMCDMPTSLSFTKLPSFGF